MTVQYIKCPGRGPRSTRSERGCVRRVLHGSAVCCLSMYIKYQVPEP